MSPQELSSPDLAAMLPLRVDDRRSGSRDQRPRPAVIEIMGGWRERTPLMISLGVDCLQVGRGGAQVGMAELAFDDVDRDALRHRSRWGVTAGTSPDAVVWLRLLVVFGAVRQVCWCPALGLRRRRCVWWSKLVGPGLPVVGLDGRGKAVAAHHVTDRGEARGRSSGGYQGPPATRETGAAPRCGRDPVADA